MNKRRTKKAVKKWYEGGALTPLERQAVIRWHRRSYNRLGITARQAAEGMRRVAVALDATLSSFADVRKGVRS